MNLSSTHPALLLLWRSLGVKLVLLTPKQDPNDEELTAALLLGLDGQTCRQRSGKTAEIRSGWSFRKKAFQETLPSDPEAAGILLFRGTAAALLHLFAAFTREAAVLLFLGFILLFAFPFFFQSCSDQREGCRVPWVLGILWRAQRWCRREVSLFMSFKFYCLRIFRKNPLTGLWQQIQSSSRYIKRGIL